ncbi:MAG: alpha/beta hydrolase [Bacteroidia bacterium]|nr:alpha/beta hydrolase [Bacteroidia bacterium]
MKNLILLHGAMGSKEQFEGLERLINQEYDLHILNFSGHGMAEFYFPEFSVQAFAEQVISYMDSKGIEKSNFFGYSLGGYVALYIARYYQDRVESVMTLATKFDWNPSIAEKEIKMLDPLLLEEKFPDFTKALVERHGEKKWKLLLEKTGQLMTALGDEPVLTENDFPGIEIPVRIGLGDKDKMVSIEESQNVFKRLKAGSFYVLPDTKHPLESVNKERLAFEIRNFVK